jgi:hypothetical protein
MWNMVAVVANCFPNRGHRISNKETVDKTFNIVY